MQSHRGGHIEVAKANVTATNYTQGGSGVGTSQRARDIPVADMPVDNDVGTGRQRDIPAVGTPDDPNYSSRSSQLKTRGDTTSVTIHYAIPPGQRFLPIVLYEAVTMIRIGDHNGHGVYEPINDFLKSPEDGLRFHRTMDFNDVYHGPLDLAPWNRPVVGQLSDDKSWIVNPLTYDPTRPLQSELRNGPSVPIFDCATPSGDAEVLGEYAAHKDVDISLLAALGAAVSRGSAEFSGAIERPVPSTSMNTPNSSIVEEDAEPHHRSLMSAGTFVPIHAADFGLEGRNAEAAATISIQPL